MLYRYMLTVAFVAGHPRQMSDGRANDSSSTRLEDRVRAQEAEIAALRAQVTELQRPAATLAPSDVQRYGRQMIMSEIGGPGQIALASSSVVVVGAGGLGCPALSYLAAAGVGRIGIVDDDVVEMSNLHRQVLHSEESIGQPKCESAAAAIRK